MNWKRWRHYLRLDLFGFTDKEYEGFYNLPWSDRWRATVAFVLFVGVMAASMMPPILRVVPPEPQIQIAAGAVVFLSFYVSCYYIWFILFPKLRRHVEVISWTLGASAILIAIGIGRGTKYVLQTAKTRDSATAGTELSGAELSNGPSLELLRLISDWAIVSGPLVLIAITLGLRWLIRITRRMHSNSVRRELDLELAGQIQERLLPPLELHRGPLSVYGRSRLALEVGGDGFDIVEVAPEAAGEQRLIAAVSDVSGHGSGAGLLMALLKGALQAEVHHRAELHNLATALNRTLHHHSTKQMYATACAVRVDPSTLSAEVVDAGHLPLLHYRSHSKTVDRIKISGLGLGLTSKAQYRSQQFQLAPGDVLLLLTDGLVEAHRRDEHKPETLQQFGLARVQSHLRDAARAAESEAGALDPRTYVESLLAAVQEFQGNDEPPEDDQTAVCIVVASLAN